jgi:hypothetical protein
MSCLTQPFPTAGLLSRNLDLEKSQLINELVGKTQDEVRVYSYVMTSVVRHGDKLEQTGSGPNFQGGCLTLCTCKHKMRASLSVKEWQNQWIAGFTSHKCGEHWLFYLARVKHVYESHRELWNALRPAVQERKSARSSCLGDLYEPKCPSECIGEFDPSHYYTPIAGHSHHKRACDNGWRIDINYKLKKLKRKPKHNAALLVGDPEFSFLWQEPMLFSNGRWRLKRWDSLSAFLQHLEGA